MSTERKEKNTALFSLVTFTHCIHCTVNRISNRSNCKIQVCNRWALKMLSLCVKTKFTAQLAHSDCQKVKYHKHRGQKANFLFIRATRHTFPQHTSTLPSSCTSTLETQNRQRGPTPEKIKIRVCFSCDFPL